MPFLRLYESVASRRDFVRRSLCSRSMLRALAILLLSVLCAFGQPTVVPDDKLPPDSIELKRNDPPATSTPWQLPKPGDPLYDAAKEAQIKRENAAKVKGNSHLVHTFERGVFKGYDTLVGGDPEKSPPRRWTPLLLRIPRCGRMRWRSRPVNSQINQTISRLARKHGLQTFRPTTSR